MIYIKIAYYTDCLLDGTPCAMKVARTVWGGGKAGDNFKSLPITIISKK
ncbi:MULTISPECIES: hypothetical protein [Bacillus cereus group]|nr:MULTISPECIES: hypothetical protein [Bacillus cereus group]